MRPYSSLLTPGDAYLEEDMAHSSVVVAGEEEEQQVTEPTDVVLVRKADVALTEPRNAVTAFKINHRNCWCF